MIVLATDSFFMAMFFFLSGLFVWPGIARKGPLNYLSDRLLRFGLPFVICAFTVIPIAYYAISLRHHPDIAFSEYWWKTITVGPWPSGPIWFLCFHPICLIQSITSRCPVAVGPAVFFAVMLAVTAAHVVLPALARCLTLAPAS
jgi:fucose 4-O-acetylase-like acetyltransferase